jgi:hypothetical protein
MIWSDLLPWSQQAWTIRFNRYWNGRISHISQHNQYWKLHSNKLMYTNPHLPNGLMLLFQKHPAIYVGEFNSRHATWGYDRYDENGELLTELASLNNHHLVIDLKQRWSFLSYPWNLRYNTDLCWVTTSGGQPLQTTRQVLDDFLESQHISIVTHIGLRIPLIKSLSQEGTGQPTPHA